MNARRMNQNQRYEVLMHFPGYEGSPCGIPRVEYAANRTTTNFRDRESEFPPTREGSYRIVHSAPARGEYLLIFLVDHSLRPA